MFSIDIIFLIIASAKDLVLRRNTLKKSLKKQNTLEKYVDPFDSMEIPLPPGSPSSMGKAGDRHWTISSLRTRFSSVRKANSLNASTLQHDFPEETFSPRRRDRSITGSIFYDDENMAVTKSLSEPAEFDALELKGKTMNELFMLLKPVRNHRVVKC